jgi:hypothetical protein
MRASHDSAERPGAARAAVSPSEADPSGGYEPPRLLDLGTLAQLTAGGTMLSQADGFGGAGASGSV